MISLLFLSLRSKPLKHLHQKILSRALVTRGSACSGLATFSIILSLGSEPLERFHQKIVCRALVTGTAHSGLAAFLINPVARFKLIAACLG
jgi:hypothetical protein